MLVIPGVYGRDTCDGFSRRELLRIGGSSVLGLSLSSLLRSERAQANWFARAASTFLADPHIEHLGFYELRDLPRSSAALGDDANYYLGLLHTDGTKKLAFSTVDLITDLLDVGTLVVADREAAVTVTGGAAGDLYHHLFLRPDSRQVLFVYDMRAAPTISVSLQRPGRRATAYALDGTSTPFPAFDGTTLSNIALSPGEVAIYVVEP